MLTGWNYSVTDSAMLKKNTSSGGNLGLAASPGPNLADSHEVGGKSNDGKEVGAKMELRLPCNVHEELDNEKGRLAALTQSNEEERAQVSPIKFESVPEAREEHTQLPTSKSTYLPVDTFKREGKCFVKHSSLWLCCQTALFLPFCSL